MNDNADYAIKLAILVCCIGLLAFIASFLGAEAKAEPVEDAFAEINDLLVEHHVDADESVRYESLPILLAMRAERMEALAAEQAAVEAELAQSWDEVAYYEPTYHGGGYAANPGSLQYDGVQTDGTWRYTWYSQRVLPGGGLDIPGRHVDEDGYVRDGDGNIAVASGSLDYGTVVETPYGTAVVYDSGCAEDTIDVYTDW